MQSFPMQENGSVHEEEKVIDEYVVKHYEHVCTKPFDEVVAAFEAAVSANFDSLMGAETPWYQLASWRLHAVSALGS